MSTGGKTQSLILRYKFFGEKSLNIYKNQPRSETKPLRGFKFMCQMQKSLAPVSAERSIISCKVMLSRYSVTVLYSPSQM